MKRIYFTNTNPHGFFGLISGLVKANNSFIFPSNGTRSSGSKFGRIRRATSQDPHILTTKQVEVSLTERGLRIFNPLNKGFGYDNLIIPFGKITFAYGSFFWIDRDGCWRQMKFSKMKGWALKLSSGLMEPLIEEVLAFSEKQLLVSVDSIEKWDEGSTVTRTFYDGKEFTDRKSADSKPTTWEDANVVFRGIVCESKITYKDVDMYGLYCELSQELETEETY